MEMITLKSNEVGKSFEIRKERLIEVFPYFASLFDSSFSDSSKEVFEVEKLRGTTYKVEEMLFTSYLEDPSNFRPNLWSNTPTRVSLKDLVQFNRLATYYGIDVQSTCESQFLFLWRTRSRSSDLSLSELESCLKTNRALSHTTTSLDASHYPTKKSVFFAVFMEYKSPVLRASWSLSPLSREKFWRELFEFTTESQYGQTHYGGMLIPYFRIMQSLPPRPHEATDAVLEILVHHLDESHFSAMKCHRDSNGHQREDFALHPTSLIQRFSSVQALWCWREWSDADHEDCRGGQGDDYQVLVRKLKQSFASLSLNGELQINLDTDQVSRLQRDIQALS